MVRCDHNYGFTLIELSIVLVIIGLIVGGVLVGRDLINAAAIRAQITQVEKYNTAVNTFRNKYGGIPGDLQSNAANQFGFVTTNCNGTQGNRDGNGLLDGNTYPNIYAQTQGETGLFWQDLSTSGLIEDTIPNNGNNAVNGGGMGVVCGGSVGYAHILTSSGAGSVGSYFPAAKIGQGNFLYSYEYNGANWFGLLDIISTDSSSSLNSGNLETSLTVAQAYRIDTKIDDGLPLTGNVQALGIRNINWLNYVNELTSDNTSSCFNSTTPGYSITINNGAGPNCGISFRFQ